MARTITRSSSPVPSMSPTGEHRVDRRSVDRRSDDRRGDGRRWLRLVALAAAVAALGPAPLRVLPWAVALPLVGLLLAWSVPADHRPGSRPVAGSRRNAAVGAALVAALVGVAVQGPLLLLLIGTIGLTAAGLAPVVLALAALALPLGLADADRTVEEVPANRFIVTRRNLILSTTVALTVGTWYWAAGRSAVALAGLVLGLPVPLVAARVVAARHRLLAVQHREPPTGVVPHRIQRINAAVLCGLLALVLPTGAWSRTVLELSDGAYWLFRIAFLAGLAALFAVAAVPLARVRAGTNVLMAVGSVFVATQLAVTYRPVTDAVAIASPLAGEWVVGHGGHSELVNYHHVTPTERDAVDLWMVVDGDSHRPGGTALTDYAVYGQPVTAPADGTVTFVVDGRPDQAIGTADRRHYLAGNNLVIDIGHGRYLMLAHLQPGSISVGVGDTVRTGQVIARVGNSGSTTEPHLHLQVQNVPAGIGDLATTDLVPFLRTVRTYPVAFRGVTVDRGGRRWAPGLAELRRGDLVRPAP